MVFFLEGSPISTEELWSAVRVTIRFLVTFLIKVRLPQLLSLAGRPVLGRVLGVRNFFHLRMFLGTFNAAENFCYLSQDLCLNPVLELEGQFLQPHGLVFAQTCTVNCGTL